MKRPRRDVYVAISPIHGMGVFASRDYKRGDVIVYDKLSYGFNHGCAPNTARYPQPSKNGRTVRRGRSVILCDVAKGEELLLDYHFNRPPEGCLCPLCTGGLSSE
jgi:SET domain-containing protein